VKTSSGPSQAVSTLSSSVSQKLNLCAMVAAAAVVLLAVPRAVEAEIVYTKVNINFITYNLDLNNDGVSDVALQMRETAYLCYPCRDGQRILLSELPATGNGVLGNPPAALKAGAMIGPNQVFYQGTGTMSAWYSASRCGCVEHHVGPWFEVANHYLGVAFKIQGKTHYGWARMSTAFRSVMLTGYAYETIAGKTIAAGATTGGAEESSEEHFVPGSFVNNAIPDSPQATALGMLALSVEQVPLCRQKEGIGQRVLSPSVAD
jgi:hypothetical protein